MSLVVLHAGTESRIIDAGRPRTRSLGVAVGGAADRRSLALGNALVGNDPETAALEVCLSGPRLRADHDVAAAVFGAPFELTGTDRTLRVDSSFTLRAGETLHIGGTPRGVRAYLCVHSGFETPTILGSRSGFEPVRVGDGLPCVESRIHARFVPGIDRLGDDPCVLRVVPGLQADWFVSGLAKLTANEFVVRPESNRMGVRLRGHPFPVPARELVSEPVCPGAVQVTRDGQCIILGVDGQTIGGYPKIAHVIAADLDRVGQLRPGARLRFVPVTLEEALRLEHAAQAELRSWLVRLRASLDGFGVACTLP